MSKVTICANCLDSFPGKYHTAGYRVGAEYGSQRDPEYHTVDLCQACITALESGDFAALHARYRSERSYTVGPNAQPVEETRA